MYRQARLLALKVLHTDDTPEKIAWGVVLGVFVAWTPTIGAQMLISALLAWLLRVNKPIAIAMAWITNPYTIVPIYWTNYVLGRALVGGPVVGWSFFADLFDQHGRGGSEHLRYVYDQLWTVFWPLWVGSVLLGSILAFASYLPTYHAVRRYQLRRAEGLGNAAA